MSGDEIEELKHTDKELVELMSQLEDGVPGEFRTIISKMTRYNPEERSSLTDVREIMGATNDTRYLLLLDSFPSCRQEFTCLKNFAGILKRRPHLKKMQGSCREIQAELRYAHKGRTHIII